MTVKEMIAQRVKLNEDARAIWALAEKENKRALTAAEREAVRKLNADINSLRDKIEEAAAGEEEERELRSAHEAEERILSQSRGRKTDTKVADPTQASEEDLDLAFRGWCLGKFATPEQRAAATRVGFNVDAAEINMGVRTRQKNGEIVRSFVPVVTNRDGDILAEARSAEGRALSIGTTTAGGNAVPNEMMRAFYEVQKWYARLEEAAYQIQTESGATLPWPTVSDTANTGRILAEATTATTTTDPTFGVVNLGAFKFSSDGVLVSWELLQDSFIDIAGYLGTALGRRIGRIKNTKFTVGAGTTEPKGVITAATVGVTAAATNAMFTMDNIIELIHKLDLAYRNLPGTGFMIHDTIAANVRKFKDAQGRYLWEMSQQVGQPDRLFGYPVLVNNDMDSALTTGKKLLAFGNIKLAYIVRNAGAVRIVRADELYVKEHQVYFEASQRSDGNLVDATAVQVLALA